MPQQRSAASTPDLFKDILRGSGIYSVDFFAQRLANTFLLPIITRFLSPAQYGVAILLEQVGSVLSLLLGGSFSSALGYFHSEAAPGPPRRAVIGTAVLGSALLGLLAAALCLPFAGALGRFEFHDEASARYLYVVMIGLAPVFLLSALNCWLRVENRPGVFISGALLRLGVTAGSIVLLLAVFRLGLWGLLYSSLAASVVPALVLAVYCYMSVRPAFDLKVFGRMARFAAPAGVGGLAMFIMHFGDQFILPHYRPFAEVGIYGLAYKFGMLLSALYGSFQSYWSAQCYAIMKRDDSQAVFTRLSTYAALVVSFTGLEIILWSGPAVRLLAARDYWGAAAYIPFIVIAYALRSVGDYVRVLFYVAGRPGYDAISNSISVAVCIASYFALIPRFGAWGAVFATMATFLTYAAIAAGWTYRLRPYRFDSARLAKIGIAAAAAGLPCALGSSLSLPLQIVLAIASSAIFPAVLWFLRFPTPGEMEIVRQALRRTAGLLAERF